MKLVRQQDLAVNHLINLTKSLIESPHDKRKRPVNPILNLGEQKPEIGAWKRIQSEECGYGGGEKR
jgi:hypothetical protein